VDKTIELSLAKDYVSDWGVWEGVRELIQNTLDAGSKDIAFGNDSITFKTNKGGLSVDKLLLGSGTKKDDSSSIGGHGEGLKVALLALVREGCDVALYNKVDSLVWKPTFKLSEVFGIETLHIEEHAIGNCDYLDDDLTIVVTGLSEEEINTIKEKYLYSELNNADMYETSYGDILFDPLLKGKVFVKGLYVSTINSLDYGYNFKPQYIKLDRDRRQVSTFDVKWQAKEMWREYSSASSEGVALLAAHVHAGTSDTEYMNHTTPTKEVVGACTDIYTEKYKGNMLADSYEDCEKLKKQGYTNVVFLGNEAFTSIVKSSRSYKDLDFNKEVVKSFTEYLEEFKDKWYDEFSTECLDDLDALISKIS